MEIRINKLARELGIFNIETICNAVGITEASPNIKLRITEVSSFSEGIYVDDINKLQMLELISLRNKIDGAIEHREAMIQLEGAMDRLRFNGIKEVTCNGYFISKIEDVPAFKHDGPINDYTIEGL